MGSFADPSAVIAAEIAFNRLAQAEGQWTAFRKRADKDAILFVPQPVNARAWLDKRADPQKSVVWWPSRVFMSCDGSYAASTGGWQRPDGSVGYFTTIWRRQKKGAYLWLIDQGDGTASLRSRPEDDLEAHVADCAPRGPDRSPQTKTADPIRIAMPPPAKGEGQSTDGSLVWRWDVRADGSRTVTVSMRREGRMQNVIEDEVKAGAT